MANRLNQGPRANLALIKHVVHYRCDCHQGLNTIILDKSDGLTTTKNARTPQLSEISYL